MRRGWGCGRSAQRSGYIARGTTTTTTTTTTTVLLCFIATDEFGQTGRRLTEGPLGKVWRGGLRKSQSQPLCLVKTKQENCIPPKKKKTHPTAPACSVEGHGHAAAGGLIEDNLAEQCVCSQLGGCSQQLTSTPPLRARNPGDRVHEQQAVRLVQKTMAAWKCSPRVMLLTSLSLVLTLTTVYIKHTRTEPPLSTRLPTALVTHRVKLVPARSGDALPSRRGGLGAGVKTCACDSCVADSGLSEWFDQRFNRDIVPLWTRENADLPDTVHHWWGSLQSQYKAQDLRTVLNRLFEIIPGQNPYQDHGWARCRRCAVVGNSGNLLGAGGGKEIDQHDFVMRINQAPTLGFETDVGARTTHHFMYPESAKNLPANVSFVLVPFKVLDLMWIASALSIGDIRFTYAPVKRFLSVDKDKVLIYNPAFFKYIHDSWTEHHGRYPSTGMVALFFALHVCDEVDVYGFGADSRGNWHHYWENNRYSGEFRKTGVHDADHEEKIIKQLTEAGKISVHRGR